MSEQFWVGFEKSAASRIGKEIAKKLYNSVPKKLGLSVRVPSKSYLKDFLKSDLKGYPEDLIREQSYARDITKSRKVFTQGKDALSLVKRRKNTNVYRALKAKNNQDTLKKKLGLE